MIKTQTDFARKNLVGDSTCNSVNDTLKTIIFTIADVCNRVCSTCPYSFGYSSPHQSKLMSLSTFKKVCKSIPDSYSHSISFSGFGEPFLNPMISEMVEFACMRFPEANIRIITNGDFPEKICELKRFKNLSIEVSCHDADQKNSDQYLAFIEVMTLKLSSALNDIILRVPERDPSMVKFLNNRAGSVRSIKYDGSLSKVCCFYPFYQMSIDVNGDVLLCQQDWCRKLVMGNAVNEDIFSIWNSRQYAEVRKALMLSREGIKCCKECNANGVFAGRDQFDMWRSIYERQ